MTSDLRLARTSPRFKSRIHCEAVLKVCIEASYVWAYHLEYLTDH